MRHIYCRGFACLIVALTGCERSAEPFNWPSFDKEVIEVGRRVLQARADDQAALNAVATAKQRPKEAGPVEAIPAAREAVLKNIKVWIDERGTRGEQAVEAIRRLGAEAVDPLLEILADDSVHPRYAGTAVNLLIPPRQEWGDKPDDAWSVVLFESANKIFDAIVDHMERHPEAQASLSNLSSITRIERIPKVIELIESSSGKRQTSYIGIFTALTYTSFPTIPQFSCGNSSYESISKAIKVGEERQRESVGTIKAWWAEHGNESPEMWLQAWLLRSIRQKTEDLKDETRWQVEYLYHDYLPFRAGILRLSVFGMLVQEFDKAAENLRPYVLRMIGSTGHADAAAFIAPHLKNADAKLQWAAVTALKDLQVSDYNETIGEILRATKDDQLACGAVEALQELAGAEALEDFTYALDQPGSLAADRATKALGSYLVSHTAQLREIPLSHSSESVRRTLGVILDGAAASAETDVEERIAATRALLRSDDPERNRVGLRLATGHPELLPDVLELIRSADRGVRSSAVGQIKKTGIPKLTVENAPRLMGYSSELDLRIAAYCYAKYGRKAVPIMKKTAFCLSDPLHPMNAPSDPDYKLIRALVQLKVPGIGEDVIRLVKDRRSYISRSHPRYVSWSHASYVHLLELLDDLKSASLVGEFLRHNQGQYRYSAIRVVRHRRLRQYADLLFELASLTFDQGDVDRLRAEAKGDGLTKQESDRRIRQVNDRPRDQYEATRALVELGDARAWQAVVICLQNKHLEKFRQAMTFGGLPIFTNFGAALSRLKTSHGNDMRDLLRKQLSGENRESVVVSLTTALCMHPEAADSDVLWSVATAPHTPEKARILATVALSKLGQRRVIPLLHELVRSFVAPGPERSWPRPFPMGRLSTLTQSDKWRLEYRQRSPRDFDYRRPFSGLMLELHHVDLGLALRRLGDETLVDELVEALTGADGRFGMAAYQFLGGMVGVRALDYARRWMESHTIEDAEFLPQLAVALLDLEVPLEAILPIVLKDAGTILHNLHVLVACDAKESADALEEAYHDLSGPGKRYKPKILDALCRLGDSRGITLAADDPLLMGSVTRYLPDADGLEFRAGHFDYNRVEEGMRLQAWYERHAGDLRWDAELSQFRLATNAP